MSSAITPISTVTPKLTPKLEVGEFFKSVSIPQPGGWQDIVAKISTYVSSPKSSGLSAQQSFNQLSGLLRLQVDVTQYQLRVEVVSKVAESAVASLRKLQQSQ